MKRKRFIELSAGAIAFLQLHSLMTYAGCKPVNTNSTEQLIKELHLLIQSPLAELKKFYCETIGFKLITESPKAVSVQAGKTVLNFELIGKATPRPFYHFAFNIPENKIQGAFEWQRKKTTVIHPSPDGRRDEVVHFPHWDAHSVFFLDPAGNLVEYIARHTLKNSAAGEFSINDILYASEIGLIVKDVKKSGKELIDKLGIREYHQSSDGFWPLGDEEGLLLIIGSGREWSGHPGQKNITSIFKTKVRIQTQAKKDFNLTGYPYEIITV